ncbi:50S ribosomal protein L29 [Candidatus Campbellbacteria bacterium RIFCSPLOWO2_01_FULL_34_15]|uniref:Large ribosomal subunit protein uL29 n=2 Tax=Candidatus Campbelliibacteriota TaxID=1752727 RepID=A0A1F5EPX4_9BACT|nr:MAG: 50S ribosomal protein L29 [Candidatus Campbellbacteria bacterium RIFCSPHIGHO2_01_FULL_34_10]OGD69448.1 MAG: 50S ribosomal protein L29 [Candidatus Campbellbacteria bacterium RIFCSPLOWO2_01_FULL_34_15]
MKKQDKQNIDDLQKMLAEKKSALRAFRFGISGSKSKNVKEGSNLKKDIAKVLTELRKREMQENIQ